MTVDSYVVYFERMKDEVLHGRTFQNSAARSFKSTWRTILAANLVSFIAAAVLFVLSVGSVRGFALYLGVTTICDVIVLWFFTRPAVILLADTGRLDRHDPFGLGAAPDACVRQQPVARSLAPSSTSRSRPPRPRRIRPVATTRWRRLILGQTAIDFWGRRWLWMAISRPAAGRSPCCRCGSAASTLGIDFEGGVAWDVPAGELTVDDARAILDDERPGERQGQDPGAQLRQRRHHQGAGRGPARGRARPAAGGVRRGRRRRPRRRQRGVGQRHLGRGDHREGGHGRWSCSSP